MLRIADPHRLTTPFLSLFLCIQITSFRFAAFRKYIPHAV